MPKFFSILCLAVLLGIVSFLTSNYLVGIDIAKKIDRQRTHINEKFSSDVNLKLFTESHKGLKEITLISQDIKNNTLIGSFWSVSFNDDTNTMIFGIDEDGQWINPRALTMTMQSPEPFR